MKRGLFAIPATGLFLFLLIVFSLNMASASVQVGNLSNSITNSYSPGSYLKGWINISLANEDSNSIIKTSENDSIKIIDILKMNKNINYACNPQDCQTSYISSTSEKQQKSFTLGTGEAKIFGFKLNGVIEGINSVSFDINSTAQASCYNQIEINLLNDESIEWINNKSVSNPCTPLKNKGCYDEGISSDEKIIDNDYCQKINLPVSPGFEIGAWIRNESGFMNLSMEINDLNGNQKAFCYLSANQIDNNGKEVSCDVNFPVLTAKEYYVCIHSKGGGGDYRTKGYFNSTNGCGYYKNPPSGRLSYAYDIFATPKMFDAVGDLKINDNSLSGYIYDYLAEKYGVNNNSYVDCPSDGCIIPLMIKSKPSQDITISNIKFRYSEEGGATENKNIYDLQSTNASINMGFQKIFLDGANFSIPDEFGNHTFSLELNGNNLFSEEIFIEKIPQITSLSPSTVMAAYPTDFSVNIDSFNSNATITSYEWNFGDGNILTTSEPKVTYAYNATGNYKLEIKITDSSGKSSSKIFDINVGSPKDAVNTVLSEKTENLDNIERNIESYSSFYKTSIENALDLSNLKDELKSIKKANSTASTDEDYIKIMERLLSLDVPSSIITSKSASSVPFFPQSDEINLDILTGITGERELNDSKSNYKDSIIAWTQENVGIKINFKEISAVFDGDTEHLLNGFELKINKISDNQDDFYIIFGSLDNLNFDDKYPDGKESGYSYIKIEGSEKSKTISFTTTEEIDFSQLPVFVSPEIRDLPVEIGNYQEWKKKSKLTLFILVMSALIFFWLIAYVVVQEWYKRKYENHLFKNRNNLYNLITYIDNSKRKGLKNKDIVSSLKKAGWDSEQINYAMNKYLGKRTGMPEIPVFKILDMFKRKKQQKPMEFQRRFR